MSLLGMVPNDRVVPSELQSSRMADADEKQWDARRYCERVS